MAATASPPQEIGWSLGYLRQVPAGDGWLTGAEREEQQRFTLAKRRAEWRLGRWTAKRAVTAWVGADRSDRVPVGIVARGPDDGFPLVEGGGPASPRLSLSHRDGVAVAAVGPHDTALGCDLELVEPRARPFAQDWFTEAEQALVAAAAPDRSDLLVTLIWSAKESALKAMGEGLRLDTRVVEVTPDDRRPDERGWHHVTVAATTGAAFEGWWHLRGDHVLVVVADRGSLEHPPRSQPRGTW